MSIQFVDWPKNGWPESFVAKVRSRIESSIRQAMNSKPASAELQQQQQQGAGSSRNASSAAAADKPDDPLSALIRGVVSVDALNLGAVAPTIAIKRITELSPSRCGLVVHFAYRGDACLSLRGVEINLDPTRVVVGSGGGGGGGGGNGGGMGRAEVVAPFFCPLTLKVKELDLSGDFRIEVLHEVAAAVAAGASEQPLPSLPGTFTEMFAALVGGDAHVADVEVGAAPPVPTKIKRKLFVQLLDDESSVLRDFSVESNFLAVPQAMDKIKNVIRAALKPTLHRFRTQGFTVDL